MKNAVENLFQTPFTFQRRCDAFITTPKIVFCTKICKSQLLTIRAPAHYANCILHAKQITTFKFSRLWWHFPDVLHRFALSTNARRSLQNKDADWLRILLNKSVTRSSSFAGWIWQVRLRLVFKMASRLYGGQIQSFLVLVGLLLLVTNAQNSNNSPIHRRFEYKYSFKPPYLAQKDGTVPFFEYSGSKFKIYLSNLF